MPSVFPGMDPFIEGDEWDDFQSRLITGISDALVPSLRPDYFVRTERRVYVEHPFDNPQLIRPDLTVVRPRGATKSATRHDGVSNCGSRTGRMHAAWSH